MTGGPLRVTLIKLNTPVIVDGAAGIGEAVSKGAGPSTVNLSAHKNAQHNPTQPTNHPYAGRIAAGYYAAVVAGGAGGLSLDRADDIGRRWPDCAELHGSAPPPAADHRLQSA